MNQPRRTDKQRAGPRGPRAPWTPALGLLAVAVGIVLGAAAWWWMAPPQQQVAQPAGAPAATVPPARVAASAPVAAAPPFVVVHASAAPPTPAVPTPRIRRTRDPDGDQTPDIADYINEGERPGMAEVIDRLHQAGVSGGLGAFSPPGTRPPLVGLAVPEDFQLPDGYVRHYQATDDGQRIEPILMFAPDRQFVDAAGRSVEIPRDRVVPPELAPPGLPVRRITIPAPADPGAPGR